jgi:hypothetical protein
MPSIIELMHHSNFLIRSVRIRSVNKQNDSVVLYFCSNISRCVIPLKRRVHHHGLGELSMFSQRAL